jgi:hypothetical protein
MNIIIRDAYPDETILAIRAAEFGRSYPPGFIGEILFENGMRFVVRRTDAGNIIVKPVRG